MLFDGTLGKNQKENMFKMKSRKFIDQDANLNNLLWMNPPNVIAQPLCLQRAGPKVQPDQSPVSNRANSRGL